MCGEPHELAVVPIGPKAVGGAVGLWAVYESCFIRGRERTAVQA